MTEKHRPQHGSQDAYIPIDEDVTRKSYAEGDDDSEQSSDDVPTGPPESADASDNTGTHADDDAAD